MRYSRNFIYFLISLLFFTSFNAISNAQTDEQILVKKALELEKEKKIAEANEVYLEISKNFPKSAAIQNNLGVNYFELNKYDEAILALRKSIDLNPNYEKAFYNLGTVFWNLKENEKALDAFENAVKINPNHKEAHAKICDIYLTLQTEKAVGCYEKLIKIAPDDVQNFSNYGVALMKTGQWKKAVEIFEKIARESSPNAEIFNNFGVSLMQIKRFPESIAALENAVKLEPGNEMMRYNLAIAQLAYNDKKSALEQYAFLKKTNENLAEKLFQTIFGGKIIFAKQK